MPSHGQLDRCFFGKTSQFTALHRTSLILIDRPICRCRLHVAGGCWRLGRPWFPILTVYDTDWTHVPVCMTPLVWLVTEIVVSGVPIWSCMTHDTDDTALG